MADDWEVLRQCPTVTRWIQLTTDSSLRPTRDWDRRLGLLQGFCDDRGTDPDTLIKESLAGNQAKNDHLRALKRWVAALPGTDAERHEAENIIRHFFMKNGMRMLVKPFSDVYNRSAS